MDNVFISYSREDSLFAKTVRTRLAEAGFATWLDVEQLRAGQDWCDEIDVAIRESVAVIVIITPEAAASPYVTYEWAYATAAGVKVIPLLLKPTTELHPRVGSLQYLDFTQREPGAWAKLLGLLEDAARTRQTHTVRVPRNAPPVIAHAVAALDSLDEQEQITAVRSLAAMNHPTVREALADAMRHPVQRVRVEAALHLAKYKDPAAMPGLIEGWLTLRDSNWECHEAAAGIGPPALPALLEALRDERMEVRGFGASVLGEIRDPAATGALIQLLKDPELAVRAAAAEALGKLGDPSAGDALRALLQDEDPAVRANATLALGRLRYAAAIPEVIQLLNTDARRVSEAAARALGEMGDTSVLPHLIQGLDFVRDEAAEALGKLGDIRAVEPLLAALGKYFSGSVPNPLAVALARLKDPRAIPVLADLLQHRDIAMRKSAAYALGELGPEAAPHLLRVVENTEQSGGEREAAAKALKRIGTPEALAAYRRWLREHG